MSNAPELTWKNSRELYLVVTGNVWVPETNELYPAYVYIDFVRIAHGQEGRVPEIVSARNSYHATFDAEEAIAVLKLISLETGLPHRKANGAVLGS